MVVRVEVQTLMIYTKIFDHTTDLGMLMIDCLLCNILARKQCIQTKMHAGIITVQRSDAKCVIDTCNMLSVQCIQKTLKLLS